MAPGGGLVFEADDNVIGVAHDDHVARGLALSPARGPKIEGPNERSESGDFHLRWSAYRAHAGYLLIAPCRPYGRHFRPAPVNRPQQTWLTIQVRANSGHDEASPIKS